MPFDDEFYAQQPIIQVPAMEATQGTIAPFQGAIDPNAYGNDMKRGKYFQWDQGQAQPIPNPYKTGIPIQNPNLPPQPQMQISQPDQGYIQQQGMPQPQYVNNGYGIQGYQAAPVQMPDWVSTPETQQMMQDYFQQSLQRAIKANQGPSKFSKAARVFGTKIAPALVGAFGGTGGAIAGGAMAQQGVLATRNAQARQLQEQQAAGDALKSAINMISTIGYKPAIAMAKEQNKAAQFNANAFNRQANTQYTQGQQNQRQANTLTWQGYKFDTNQERLERNQAWKQQFAQMKVDVDLDKFNQSLDLKNRIHDDMVELRRISQKIAIRGQDAGLLKSAQSLAARVQENMIDHQFDVNKFNSEMEFKIKKAQEQGNFPQGMDPQKLMLEFNQAAAIDPNEIGMSLQDYDSIVEQVGLMGASGGRQQQQAPQQESLSAQPMAWGQQASPPQQPAMPQQAPFIPQPKGGAKSLQLSKASAPVQRGSLLNSNGKRPMPQQQQQSQPVNIQRFMQSSGDANNARGRLVQSAMQRGMNYQQALQAAEAILSGQR